MFNTDTNRWLKVGNTSILMRLDESCIIPEWDIVGHTVFRKPYEDYDAMWYVFVGQESAVTFHELSEAREYLESLLS